MVLDLCIALCCNGFNYSHFSNPNDFPFLYSTENYCLDLSRLVYSSKKKG